MITDTVWADRPVMRAMSDLASAPCWRTSDSTTLSLWARMPDWFEPRRAVVSILSLVGSIPCITSRSPGLSCCAADDAFAQDHIGEKGHFGGGDDGMRGADTGVKGIAAQWFCSET